MNAGSPKEPPHALAPDDFGYTKLRLSKIVVNPTRSPQRLMDADLSDLLESLPDIGLLYPILVMPCDDAGRHELLAGHRRFRAARQLGWEEIPARIVTLDSLRAELAALAENLARRALPPGEELLAIARAKTIYESLHPDAKHGGARPRPAHPSGHLKTESFAEHAAKSTGQSARTIRRKARIGELAHAEVIAALDDRKISLIDAERIVVPGTAAREREGRTIPRSSFNAASARARPDQPSARMRDQPDISRLLQTLDETLRTLCESITCLDVASVETFHELLCRVRHALIQTLRLVEQRVHRERD